MSPMGLFDRLLGNRSESVKVSGQGRGPASKPDKEPVFLDPDAASSLGDVNFMRRSNTIRHTFPGTADSPGNKEMVAEVASMEARLEAMTPGLAGTNPNPEVTVDLSFDDRCVNLVEQGVDVAIRMGRLADSSLGARYLGVNPWVLVGSPDYLR